MILKNKEKVKNHPPFNIKMPSISLCMITKNEENFLLRYDITNSGASVNIANENHYIDLLSLKNVQ